MPIKAALEFLEKFEWWDISDVHYIVSEYYFSRKGHRNVPLCIFCDNLKSEGHDEVCPLNKLKKSLDGICRSPYVLKIGVNERPEPTTNPPTDRESD